MATSRGMKRSELHALVWIKPLTKVAAYIGISDVALAKACRRQSIPLPGRGYWRRKECGAEARVTPLAPLSSGADPVIAFQSRPAWKATKVLAEIAGESRPEDVVEVPSEVIRPSRFVRRTIAILRMQRRRAHPLMSTKAADAFRVSVSRASLDRVQRILHPSLPDGVRVLNSGVSPHEHADKASSIPGHTPGVRPTRNNSVWRDQLVRLRSGSVTAARTVPAALPA